MANPAREVRDRVQAKWPGATVVGRGRKWMKHQHPSNPRRFIFSSSTGSLHYQSGSSWIDIETDWVDSDNPGFDDQSNRNNFKVLAKNDTTRRIYPRTDVETEYIEFGVMQYWWNNQWRSLPQGVKNRDLDELSYDSTDVRLAFLSLPDEIKFDATLKTANAPTRIRFPVILSGLTLDSNWNLVSTAEQVMVGNLPSPTMTDANNEERSVAVIYSGGYVEYNANVTGLTYPIDIDPTVTLQPTGGAQKDTYISGLNTTTNYASGTRFNTGREGTNNEARSLIQFTGVNTIPAGSTCTSAELTLWLHFADTAGLGRSHSIFELDSSVAGWTESGATWLTYDGTNNWATSGLGEGTDYNSTAIGTANAPAASLAYMYMSLDTTAAEDWFGSPNEHYGFLFKMDTLVNYSKCEWRSGNSTPAPILEIVYDEGGEPEIVVSDSVPVTENAQARVYIEGELDVFANDTVSPTEAVTIPPMQAGVIISKGYTKVSGIRVYPLLYEEGEPTNLGTSDDWPMDGHDAQRTSYSTSTEPASSGWTFEWTWNGPNPVNSDNTTHFVDCPREGRAVTGGAYIYVPAGANGVYALNKNDGSTEWQFEDATVNASPAFDVSTGYLYIGGADGYVYKVNSDNGTWSLRFAAHSAINKAMLLANGYVYAVTSDGYLHKINPATMEEVWYYSAGSNAVTGAAYSADSAALVFCTYDLYVHCVEDTNGSGRWTYKDPEWTGSNLISYEGYWPVIAEDHGIVFVRHGRGVINSVVYSGPGTGSVWLDNDTNRAWIISNPSRKSLFALDLVTGLEAFLPAVGQGGVESDQYTTTYILHPILPVIKTVNGNEVAYLPFRDSANGQTDARWDGNMGEMVLDNTTNLNLEAGDFRFITMFASGHSYVGIIDEWCPITMAGNAIIHNHWGAMETVIVDSADILNTSKGLTYADRIAITRAPKVVRRVQATFTPNHSTRYHGSVGMILYDDSRQWNSPAFFGYFDCIDPPTPIGAGAYSDGMRPRNGFVCGGKIIYQGNGGEIMVFDHGGA